MLNNRFCKILIVLLITLVTAETVDAQRRTRTRSNPRERQQEASDDLSTWYSISLGTLGFGRGFSISGKFSYALKVQNRFSVGAYGKAYYDLVNNFNSPDESLFSYGGGAFGRVSITDDIFLQGEYSYTSFDLLNNNGREEIVYPSIGGGYKAGYGDWTYGFHLQLPLNERARDFVNLEYWIDFNYKF